MTPITTHLTAIENVLKRRGIDLYNQDLRGFMELGGAVDEHLWQEIKAERDRLNSELPITMFPAKPLWRFW